MLGRKVQTRGVVVLLTASVYVEGVPFVRRDNYNDRVKDYQFSLSQWLRIARTPIVFCENTGAPMAFLPEVQAKVGSGNLEVIRFQGNKQAKRRGKGWGEYEIIQHALHNSRLISDNSFVIKVTGRYYLRNIRRYLRWLNSNGKPFVNVNFIDRSRVADSRIFGFTMGFFDRYFEKYSVGLNDFQGYYFEHALGDATIAAISEGHSRMPLPMFPDLVGYSASSGEKITTPVYKLLYRKYRYNLSLRHDTN